MSIKYFFKSYFNSTKLLNAIVGPVIYNIINMTFAMHNIYANTYTTAVVSYTSLTHGSKSWPNTILISDRWVDYLNRFYLTINSILEQKILHVLFSHLKTEMPMYLAILLIHCYIKIIHILLFTFSTGSFLLFIVLKYKPASATHQWRSAV